MLPRRLLPMNRSPVSRNQRRRGMTRSVGMPIGSSRQKSSPRFFRSVSSVDQIGNAHGVGVLPATGNGVPAGDCTGVGTGLPAGFGCAAPDGGEAAGVADAPGCVPGGAEADSPRRLAGREFLISDLRQKPVSASRSRAIAVLQLGCAEGAGAPVGGAAAAGARRRNRTGRPLVSSMRDRPWSVPSRARPESAPCPCSYRPRHNSLGRRSHPCAVAPAFPCALSRVSLRKCRRAASRRSTTQTNRAENDKQQNHTNPRAEHGARLLKIEVCVGFRPVNSLGEVIRSGADRASGKSEVLPTIRR